MRGPGSSGILITCRIKIEATWSAGDRKAVPVRGSTPVSKEHRHGEYTALSNERNEQGSEEVEDQYSRVTQHQKRARKLEGAGIGPTGA